MRPSRSKIRHMSQELSARFQDAMNFMNQADQIGDMFQNLIGEYSVIRVVLNWKLFFQITYDVDASEGMRVKTDRAWRFILATADIENRAGMQQRKRCFLVAKQAHGIPFETGPAKLY